MKLLIKLMILSLVASNCASMEPWQKRTASFAGSAVTCGIIANQLAKGKDNIDNQASFYKSATICGAAGLAVGEYMFKDPTKVELQRKLAHKQDQIDKMKLATNQERSGDWLSSIHIEKNYGGNSALRRMISNDCVVHKYTLGTSSSYIPVDENIVIRSLEYYVARPKDINKPQTKCVQNTGPYKYLNLELPGLGELLFTNTLRLLEKK